MASLDSLVKGTQTLAMWTTMVSGPVGQRPARLREAVAAASSAPTTDL